MGASKLNKIILILEIAYRSYVEKYFSTQDTFLPSSTYLELKFILRTRKTPKRERLTSQSPS